MPPLFPTRGPPLPNSPQECYFSSTLSLTAAEEVELSLRPAPRLALSPLTTAALRVHAKYLPPPGAVIPRPGTSYEAEGTIPALRRSSLAERFSASRFWQQVREQRITLVRHLGELLAALCHLSESPGDRDHTLRAVYGGRARADVAEEFHCRFGAAVVEGYGLTETNTALCNSIQESRRGAIGRPLPYGEARIADEQGLALPDFKTGEIQIRRGPVLMTDYVGHTDLTQEVFDGDWFRTGDLGYPDADGWFYFVARKKERRRR